MCSGDQVIRCPGKKVAVYAFCRHMVGYCLFLVLIVGLVACRQSQPAIVESTSPIQMVLVSSDFAVGQPRVAFALRDGPQAATGVQSVALTAVLIDGETTWSGTATPYDDYEIPYWVAYPELPTAGFWGFTAQLTMADNSAVEATFIIDVKANSLSPVIGAAAPASQNRTLASEPDINKLSSGQNPNSALYQLTVAEAITSGKPTVVAFVTPGLCESEWCLPVLNSVEEVRANVGQASQFIHIEVYEDFEKLTRVKEMREWGLETEPWVFVLDENGRIAAKFSGPLSPRELSNALIPLLP